MKDITNVLAAYEKFIHAGVDFQSLCNEDDFKNYLYTIQDYENKKPVSILFLAALNTPKIFRKETENFIKEVIKTSGLEQTDPTLREKFKKFVYSWKRLLIEIENIPDDSRVELIAYLRNTNKNPEQVFSLVEEFRSYENTDITEKLVALFWEGLSDYSSDVWFDSSSKEKEELLWWALEKLEEPIDREEALDIFWQWAEGLEEDSFVNFDGLVESQTLKTLSTSNVKVEEKNGHFEIYKDGKLICTCDSMREVKDELGDLEESIGSDFAADFRLYENLWN